MEPPDGDDYEKQMKLFFKLFLSNSLLTTVTSIVSFAPPRRSHRTINMVANNSEFVSTSRVPSMVRKLKHNPSTDDLGAILWPSNTIVTRAHCSLSSAWFGQQLILAGNFGGATRLDGSRARQSPRGSHGPYRQVSCSVGTHTSWPWHLADDADATVDKQFSRPHQMFEHFGLPLWQMHELQSLLDWCRFMDGVRKYSSKLLLYDWFKHTSFELESTGRTKNGFSIW